MFINTLLYKVAQLAYQGKHEEGKDDLVIGHKLHVAEDGLLNCLFKLIEMLLKLSLGLKSLRLLFELVYKNPLGIGINSWRPPLSSLLESLCFKHCPEIISE